VCLQCINNILLLFLCSNRRRTSLSEHVFVIAEHESRAPNSSAAAARSRHPRAAPSSSTTTFSTAFACSPAFAHLGYSIICSFVSVRLRLSLGCGPRGSAFHFPVELSLDGDKH
jgi:hypothetical protein